MHWKRAACTYTLLLLIIGLEFASKSLWYRSICIYEITDVSDWELFRVRMYVFPLCHGFCIPYSHGQPSLIRNYFGSLSSEMFLDISQYFCPVKLLLLLTMRHWSGGTAESSLTWCQVPLDTMHFQRYDVVASERRDLIQWLERTISSANQACFSDVYLKFTLWKLKTLSRKNHPCWKETGNQGDELKETVKKLDRKEGVYLGRKWEWK